MSITDPARTDALFKKLQARTNTGTGISLSSEASSISHVYSTQMGALPVPYPPPSDADIAASYPWIVKKTSITYDTLKGAPSYRAYMDSRVTNIIPYYPISVFVGDSELSANKYILDFDTGAIVIYTTIAGAPTITFYQYNDQFSTQRSFTLDGSGAVFYPIVFTISPKAFVNGSYSINVWRSDVHENGLYTGTFDLKVRGRLYLWGHDADYLEWKYVNRVGDSVISRFVGDVKNTDKNYAVIVFLRGGGLTYTWSGTGISGIDASSSTTKILPIDSESYSSLSALNTYFNYVTGSWDSRTKQLILNGVISESVGLHNDLGDPSFPSTTSGSARALEVNGTMALTGPLVINSITHQKYSFSATPPYPFTSQALDTLTSSSNYIFYNYGNYKIVINPRYGPGWYEIDYTNNSSGESLQMGSALVAVLSVLTSDGVGTRYKMRRVRDNWYSGRINCDLETDSSEVGNSDSSKSYGFIISNLTLSATYQFRINYTAFPS